jgi:molybdopterin-guanine dinucleotide biosynthesis protein A
VTYPEITAGILVGGRGERMGGRDKARLPRPGGGTFLEHLVQQLRDLVGEIVLLGRADQSYPEVPCRLLVDRVPGAGPLAGLDTLLASGASWGLLVACDLGAFDADLVDLLAAGRGSRPVVVPHTNRSHWTCALYAAELAPEVGRALGGGELALHQLAGRAGFTAVEIPKRLRAALTNTNVDLPARTG